MTDHKAMAAEVWSEIPVGTFQGGVKWRNAELEAIIARALAAAELRGRVDGLHEAATLNEDYRGLKDGVRDFADTACVSAMMREKATQYRLSADALERGA